MAQGLEVIDSTVQKTNLWLKEVMEEAGWDDRHKAYLALRAVLHALRDRLTPEEAAHLSAQLPMLVRGLFFEGWRPADVPRRIRNKREFFALAASYFPDTGDQADPEVMTRAVLRTLARNVTTGEIKGRSRTVAGRSGGDAHSPGTGSWTDLDSRLVSILAASRDEKHENLSEAHIHYHDHSDRPTDCRNG